MFAHSLPFSLFSLDQAFRISQINDVAAYAVAILGLNLVIGYSGQLSLGQSAFVGLGAYTTIILVADYHWSYFATIPVSAALCFVVGMIVGLPALRMSGLYLAIVTLAVAYVFPTLVLKFESLTGGPNGKKPDRGEAEMIPPSWMPFADDGRIAEPLWIFCVLVVIADDPVPAGAQLHQEPAWARTDRRSGQPDQRIDQRCQRAALQVDGVRRQRRVRWPRRHDADDQPAVRVGRAVRADAGDLPRRRPRRRGCRARSRAPSRAR